MGNKYSCLNFEERKNIEILYKNGMSCAKIAQQINRSAATVYREVERNSKDNCYNASAAQANANLNKKVSLNRKQCGEKTMVKIQRYMTLHPQASIKEIAAATDVCYQTARTYHHLLKKEQAEKRRILAGVLEM